MKQLFIVLILFSLFLSGIGFAVSGGNGIDLETKCKLRVSVNIKKAKGDKIRFIYHCRKGCSKIVERYFFVKYLDKSGKPIGFWSDMNLHANNSTEEIYMCSLPPGTSSIEMDGHVEDLEGHTAVDMKVLEL